MKKKSKKRLWLYQNKWLTVGSFTGQICDLCGEPLLYYYDFDAQCCPRCNEWKEKACSNSDCEFCRKRPDTPLDALKAVTNKLKDGYFIEKYEKRLKGLGRRKFVEKILKEKCNQE